MRACLIYCGIGVAGFNLNYPRPRQPGDREGSWIGHGVASVGASTKAAGHTVQLIDLRQMGGWKNLAARLNADGPADVYGLSVSAVDHYSALKAVFEIKSRYRDVPVIVGGIHPTIFPEQYDYPVIDCVVQGEGEVTFPKLLERLSGGEALPKVIRGEQPDLNAIPWVDRELFDYRWETQCNFTPDQRLPSVTMLAGRGCPYRCTYCQPAENAVFGRPYRLRSPENVIAELDVLMLRYGFKSITFWDDTFTFSPGWIARFCDLYERAGFGAPIAACSRADIIVNNPEMVKRLAAVGLDWFVIGLESGSQRLLDLIHKGTTVEQNVEAIRICRQNGIKVFGTFMLGLPTETREESAQTFNFINTVMPEIASPFWYTPIPGTGLYDYCVENGLLLNENPDLSIARTGVFMPRIKGVDYDYLRQLMVGGNA